jgi:hypothetical protein
MTTKMVQSETRKVPEAAGRVRLASGSRLLPLREWMEEAFALAIVPRTPAVEHFSAFSLAVS